jgi:hypothetical protein
MNGPKLLTPIASNKNEGESNKNLIVMTWANKAQLLRYAIRVMTFKQINLTPPLKMGNYMSMD